VERQFAGGDRAAAAGARRQAPRARGHRPPAARRVRIA
jgi:hypothetical protein